MKVLGHAKTILVLLVGWALLGDTINRTQLFGMALTIIGMVLYGYFSRYATFSQCEWFRLVNLTWVPDRS